MRRPGPQTLPAASCNPTTARSPSGAAVGAAPAAPVANTHTNAPAAIAAAPRSNPRDDIVSLHDQAVGTYRTAAILNSRRRKERVADAQLSWLGPTAPL